MIRLKPGTYVQAGNSRHHTIGYFGSCSQRAAIIEDNDAVPISNLSTSGVFRIQPDFIVSLPFKKGDIIKLGVDPGSGVRADQLQWIFLGKGIFRAFPWLDVFGNGRYLRIFQRGYLLAVNFDFTRRG